MTELNPFQEKCEGELARRLALHGVHITDRKIVEGAPTSFSEAETFIEAIIGDISIWIYDDSADVKSDTGTQCFEAPDYRTEDELIKAFVDKVVSLLREGERGQLGYWAKGLGKADQGGIFILLLQLFKKSTYDSKARN